jgi:transcriptional regulator with XRE-family HTH domain
MPERRSSTPRKGLRTTTGRRSAELRRSIGHELRRMRADAGLSQRQLTSIADLDQGYLSLVERGLREPSLSVLVALSTALGGSVSVRVHPGTGPRLRDPIQARITETLMRVLDRRWTALLEVPVYRPARGVIDLVLHDPDAGVIVAAEVQSEIRRLEQTIRWSNEKAASLPSAEMWRFVDAEPRIDRLLVLRSTRINREIATRFDATLAAAYPVRAADAFAGLTEQHRPWPGSAVLWARVDGDDVRILDRAPRMMPRGPP